MALAPWHRRWQAPAMPRLSALLPDKFVLILIGAVVLASLVPVGDATLAAIGGVSTAAIVLLFFLHGVRISPAAVLAGIRNWRLQLAILGFGYVAMPVAGLGVSALLAPLLGAGLAAGLLYLAVMPTTVQSSIAYSSIAGGNVAASVIASAASNVLGVVVSPFLFAALAEAGMIALSASGVMRIALILLLPFLVGQLARRWLIGTVERHRRVVGWLDRATIVLAVFVAFAEAARDGLWSRIDAGTLALLIAVVAMMLLAALGAAWMLGRALGLPAPDRVSLLFSGAHKSLATGAPMARILFPGGAAGAVLLPLLIYHQLQLMLSAVIAERLSTDARGRSAKRA